MLLTPAAARPWLAPDSRNRTWPGHGAMMIRRREALAGLGAAYASWARLGAGTAAWALGMGGAVLVGRGVAAGGEGSASAVGIGLLLLGTFLGGAVVATGSALARATAAWWTLATAVRADGARADATTPDPETRRAHQEAVAHDRRAGAWELWRPPLLPRTLAVLLLTAGGAVLLVRAALGYGEASTGYAGDDLRGQWLTGAVAALVCLLAAALTASGLRRVHRARMHRVRHEEPPAAGQPAGELTPALGSGAIVVGGPRPPAGGPPPGWTSAPPATSAAPAPPVPGARPDAGGQPDTGGQPGADVEPAGTQAEAPEPIAAGPVPARVRLSDGREIAAGVTLLGRAPRPRPEEGGAAVLAVTDERVSKTHLTVWIEQDRVVVTDRGSTNGTVVHHPAGDQEHLRPGEPRELTEGAVVVLGATTLTVGEPPDDVEHTVLRPQ